MGQESIEYSVNDQQIEGSNKQSSLFQYRPFSIEIKKTLINHITTYNCLMISATKSGTTSLAGP